MPGLRERVHAFFAHIGDSTRATASAAGIACLVGRCEDPQKIIREAREQFRLITLDRLNLADIANNTPDPLLFPLTEEAALGEVDAFVSHSWSDSASLKWDALSLWSEQFALQNSGRKPTLWFDKCCIDQNNIVQNLRCLPMFLSGCRTLLILCGPTYLQRLWCILEIFTFMHMGGNPENVTLILVGAEDEDMSTRPFNHVASANTFDARLCHCFDAGDKRHLLGVIRAAFGTLHNFNMEVSDLLRRVGLCG